MFKCPYCNGYIGMSYDEEFNPTVFQLYEAQCFHCNKNFTYSIEQVYNYTAYKADCLNGGEHIMEKVIQLPKCFPNWVRCQTCNYEEKGEFDKDAL
jgi:hypothetical protein